MLLQRRPQGRRCSYKLAVTFGPFRQIAQPLSLRILGSPP